MVPRSDAYVLKQIKKSRLCSVAKHAGSGRARKNRRRDSFFYLIFVLFLFFFLMFLFHRYFPRCQFATGRVPLNSGTDIDKCINKFIDNYN